MSNDNDFDPATINWDNLEEREKYIGRKPCCKEDWGGSHYHCGRCGKVSSMMGHFIAGHFVNGKFKKSRNHFCCPGNCELDDATRKD